MEKAIMDFNEADVIELATRMARQYKRRCRWANVDDLRQQASLTICEAARTYDPRAGDFLGYAYKACQYSLGAYLRSARLPIEISPTLLDGVHMDGWENAYLEHDWRERVRARVTELVQAIEDGNLALRVLLCEKAPREVSDDRVRVYRAVQRAKVSIRKDLEMRELARCL